MPAFSHTKLNICQKPRRHSKHTTNIVINDQYNINNKASQTKSCLISYWTSCLTVRFLAENQPSIHFELKLNGGIYKTEYHNHCLLSIKVTLDILWTHIYIRNAFILQSFWHVSIHHLNCQGVVEFMNDQNTASTKILILIPTTANILYQNST